MQTQIPWQPTASIKNLKRRANVLAVIRHFFNEKGVMEVETPLLCDSTIPDPYIDSFSLTHQNQTYYLQTSPEFAMKRLLAAGSGPIYQICKAFRREESGRLHSSEFTMLEWYRPGFDHHDLMDEMDELLQCVLNVPSAERTTYQALFEKHLGIDPHACSLDTLKKALKTHNIQYNFNENQDNKDTLLNLLLTHCIEPELGFESPFFIYDYPASQSALAKINGNVAERFEVYYQGMELANGFHELLNAKEQRERFVHQLAERERLGLETPPLDEAFLAALDHGLPPCAGVALGVDRLVMLALDRKHIKEVLSF